MIRLSTPQPARHPAPTVKASGLAFVRFERPDLDRAATFLTDFGLHVVSKTEHSLFLRGAGRAPYCYRIDRGPKPRFAGAGFDVGSRDDLTRLARLPGASPLEPEDGPGGGERVRLRDPSGFEVVAIALRAPSDALPHRAPLPMNFPEAPARINLTQRPKMEPPEVLRIGHLVLEAADFQKTCAWYTEHLGLIPSDVQVLPDGSPAVTFLRVDRGDVPVDHHSLALAQGVRPAYGHTAFEVVDADAVGIGQRILRDRGWRHAWGMGRHILGSQIFDYWEDAWGDKHEHYCDGDVFTADMPAGIHPASREAMAQWGEIMPASFTKPKLTLGFLAAVAHHVRRSPDLSIRKLMTLAKLFG